MELLHARPRVALLALAAGASLCLLGLAAPAAADAADYPTAIDPASLQLTTASIVNNGDGVIHREEAVRITGAWHVADGAKAGDTFGMTLPSVFAGTGVSFDLLAPDGVAVATCVVPAAAAEMTCTLALRPDAGTAGYVGDGVFTVWVQAVGETVEESVGFVIGGVEFEIDLPGEGGIIGPWGVSDWPGKYGWEAGGRIGWSITIPEWWAAEHSWRIDGENPDSRAFFMVTDTLADGMVPTNIWWIDSTRVSDASVSVPLNQWCDDPITET